jgi:hypothetical protein
MNTPNIKIIKTGINPEPFLKRVYDNWNDWDWVSSLNPESIGGDKDPYGFLPLIWAKVDPGEDPKNSEQLQQTPLFSHYPEVVNFWKENNISSLGRAAFFKLLPGGTVGRHIDEGTYYLKKDRYHLSLQSRYHYTVGNEEMIVEPGTFFWFNNKLEHGAKNIGDVDRISLVFDVPHNKRNPHHKVGKTKIKGKGFL